MAAPGNINPAPPPSSFDNNPEFFEEGTWNKLIRRCKREPLIPLGLFLTCWALVEAGKSIRQGDKHRTNRMFRRRIYAQGFTLLCMVGGSYYWAEDRAKEKSFNILNAEKRRQERQEAWLRELEARDKEEDELRKIRDKMALQGAPPNSKKTLRARVDEVKQSVVKSKDAAKTKAEEATQAAAKSKDAFKAKVEELKPSVTKAKETVKDSAAEIADGGKEGEGDVENGKNTSSSVFSGLWPKK